MEHEWPFEEKMQHNIAIEVAKGVPDYGAYKDLFKASPMEIAANILAIPEIRDALESRKQNEGSLEGFKADLARRLNEPVEDVRKY